MKCNLNIKASNGENSLLFKDIVKGSQDLDSAIDMYYYTHTNAFKEEFGDWEAGESKFELDENNEPKFSDLTKEGYSFDTDYSKTELDSKAEVYKKLAALEPTIVEALHNRIEELKGRSGDYTDLIARLEAVLVTVETKGLESSLPTFIDQSVKHLEVLKKRSDSELREESPSINKMAGYNKAAQTYQVLAEIRDQITDNVAVMDMLGLEGLDVDKALNLINKIDANYLTYANDYLVHEFHRRNTSWDKKDIQKWLKESPRDLQFTERMLEYLGDSHDRVLAATANVVYDAEARKRREQIEFTKDLQDRLEILEDKYPGAKSAEIFDTMIHEAANGELHILDINATDTKGKNPEMDAMYRKIQALRSDPAKFEFFQFFVTKYAELQVTLPPNARMGTRLPTVLKSSFERAESKGLKGKITAINDEVKKKFLRSNLDQERGQLKDSSGKPIRKIPTFYTQKYDSVDYNNKYSEVYDALIDEGYAIDAAQAEASAVAEEYAIRETAQFISRDLAYSLASFHAMAINYTVKNDIVNTIDAATAIVGSDKRKYYTVDSAGRPVKRRSGTMSETNDFIRGKNSTAYKVLQNFLDVQVYGQKHKDLGTIDVGFAKLDTDKSLRALNNSTSLVQLALNVFAAIPNIGNGEFNNAMEAFVGEYYSKKNYTKSSKMYRTNLGGMMGDIGQRTPKNIINLLDQHYNILQDFNVQGDIKVSEGSTAKRMMNTSALFFMNNMGEHFMQVRTGMSILDNTKTYTKAGVETGTLLDAHTADNGKLIIKDGIYIKAENGDLVKYDTAQQDRMGRKLNAITRKMYGNYNAHTANEMKRDARLALVMKFRDWAYEGVVRRYGKKQYYTNLEQEVEGFYRTGGMFVKNIAMHLKDMKLDLMKEDWQKLTPHEKANVKRMITEASAVTLLSIAGALLGHAGKAIEDDYASDSLTDRLTLGSYRMLVYQTNRLYTELFAYVNPVEALRLMQTPMASTSIIEGTLKLMGQIMTNPTEQYTTGWREGEYKVGARLEKLIPVYKQLKVLNPDGIKDKGIFYNL